jgi:putative FmdB family regulatory protein
VPIYEYRCKKGHTFEVMQSMSDEPVTACVECSSPVERVFHPVAVHFKGSGFYTTDYGRKRGGGGDSASGGESGKNDSKEPASAKSESSGGSDGLSGSGSPGSGEGSGKSASGGSKSGGPSD